MARDKYWQHSFRTTPSQPERPTADEGQRYCARADWCASSVIVTEDGKTRRDPALGYQAFCIRDREHIARSLDEIPALYTRLHAELGEKGTAHGERVSMSRSAPLPLNTSVDALMRSITEALYSWHERVAAVARLSFPSADLSRRRRDAIAVDQAVTVLGGHLDALLALGSEDMWRTRPEGLQMEELDGAAAGLEILSLHYRIRAVIGETRPHSETFDGIPCRACEDMALERAEPPSDPDAAAKKSRCASCGDTMDDEEFGAWADRYSKWADSAGLLACRRCQKGKHEQCAWDSCPCRATGHPAEHAAA